MRSFLSDPLRFPVIDFSKMFYNTMPDVDIIDEGDSIKVRIDLPGIQKEDIKLHVDGNWITVSARSRADKKREWGNYYFRERSSKGYYRRISLPVEVDDKSVHARMDNGTLEVDLNKARRRKHGEVRIR